MGEIKNRNKEAGERAKFVKFLLKHEVLELRHQHQGKSRMWQHLSVNAVLDIGDRRMPASLTQRASSESCEKTASSQSTNQSSGKEEREEDIPMSVSKLHSSLHGQAHRYKHIATTHTHTYTRNRNFCCVQILQHL